MRIGSKSMKRVKVRTRTKSFYRKEEILKMTNVLRVRSVTKAMSKGYFSKTTLKLNSFRINYNDYVFCYSVLSKAYIKAYRSNEAYELYQKDLLKFK